MKKLITLIVLLAAAACQGQIVYVVDLDLDLEWMWTHYQNKNKITQNLETGQVVARYKPADGWYLQQSGDLVNWIYTYPKYAVIDGDWIEGVFTIINPNPQFFRFTDEPPKGIGKP